MKQESVLSVLMYLLKNQMTQNCELLGSLPEIVDQLQEAGFEQTEILQAFDWLESLAFQSANVPSAPSQTSFRVFSEVELDLLGKNGVSFLLELQQQGILNNTTFELVITQVIELFYEQIDLSLIKWVTLMVLYNQSGGEKELAKMELLVLESSTETERMH